MELLSYINNEIAPNNFDFKSFNHLPIQCVPSIFKVGTQYTAGQLVLSIQDHKIYFYNGYKFILISSKK